MTQDHPRSPPLDFPLFGLAHWDGPKWAYFYEGEVGKPVLSVLLAHAEGEQLIIVKTAPRERWDRLMAGSDPDASIPAGVGEADIAFSLVTSLMDMARPIAMAQPGPSTEDRSRYNRGLVAFAEKESKNWESWEPARWTLGVEEQAARVFRFAHGWTGFSADHPDFYLGVTAFNMADTEIDLAEVTGEAYNFDFSVPFGIQELQDQVGSVPDIEPIIRAATVHPDHLLVMATEPDPKSLPVDNQGS